MRAIFKPSCDARLIALINLVILKIDSFFHYPSIHSLRLWLTLKAKLVVNTIQKRSGSKFPLLDTSVVHHSKSVDKSTHLPRFFQGAIKSRVRISAKVRAVRTRAIPGNPSPKARSSQPLWAWVKCTLDSGHQKNISIEKQYDSRYSFSYQSCDTRLYVVEKDFYLKKLLNSHKNSNDFQSYFLEHAFAKDIILSKVTGTDFKIKPLVYGISGSTGQFTESHPESIRKKW